MKTRHCGFTLMEMVGVVAVIAILASVATPMVLDAISKARTTSFLGTIKNLRTATMRYYEDTGRLPEHIPSSNVDGQRLLMRNSSNSPVRGWDGPYLDSELLNPFVDGGWIAIRSGTETGQQFDFDGDGALDTSDAVFVTVGDITFGQAREISDAIDGDGDQDSGSGAWFASGRVKMWGGSASSTAALVFISERR